MSIALEYTKEERIQIYKENFGKPYKDLAKIAKVSYQTVCTDMREWRKTGGFIDYVYERFGPLHETVENLDPMTAYKMLGRLIEKDMGDKQQVDVNIEVGEKLHAVLGGVFGVKREDDPSS